MVLQPADTNGTPLIPEASVRHACTNGLNTLTRNIGMVTSEEWENLAKAVEAESGERVEWRTHDEIDDAEEKAG